MKLEHAAILFVLAGCAVEESPGAPDRSSDAPAALVDEGVQVEPQLLDATPVCSGCDLELSWDDLTADYFGAPMSPESVRSINFAPCTGTVEELLADPEPLTGGRCGRDDVFALGPAGSVYPEGGTATTIPAEAVAGASTILITGVALEQDAAPDVFRFVYEIAEVRADVEGADIRIE